MWLPLNVAAIILGCILSMLVSVFNILGPLSITNPPTVALTVFFHADTVASVHPLSVSWYLIFSLCVYLCFCMHIMSILCFTAYAVSSCSWPILFKVQTLNVTICIVCLHFSSFCFLSSVADLSNTERPGLQPQQDAALFYLREERSGLYMWLECGSWLSFDSCFILFYRSHSYRGAAVVPRSKWRSWALSCKTHVQDKIRLCVWLSKGLFAYLYVHHAASHGYVKKKRKKMWEFNFLKF